MVNKDFDLALDELQFIVTNHQLLTSRQQDVLSDMLHGLLSWLLDLYYNDGVSVFEKNIA